MAAAWRGSTKRLKRVSAARVFCMVHAASAYRARRVAALPFSVTSPPYEQAPAAYGYRHRSRRCVLFDNIHGDAKKTGGARRMPARAYRLKEARRATSSPPRRRPRQPPRYAQTADVRAVLAHCREYSHEPRQACPARTRDGTPRVEDTAVKPLKACCYLTHASPERQQCPWCASSAASRRRLPDSPNKTALPPRSAVCPCCSRRTAAHGAIAAAAAKKAS